MKPKIKAVEIVRSVRDEQYEQYRDWPEWEKMAFYRTKAEELFRKLGIRTVRVIEKK